MKPLPLENVKRLKALAKEANERFDQMQYLGSKGRQVFNETISEAILMGKALAEAKELLSHGQWMRWIEKHCNRISYETANRWIRLAKLSLVTNLESTMKKAAYLEAGILKKPEARGPVQLTIDTITRAARWWSRDNLKPTILQWNEDEKQRVVEELKPVVELYKLLSGGAHAA